MFLNKKPSLFVTNTLPENNIFGHLLSYCHLDEGEIFSERGDTMHNNNDVGCIIEKIPPSSG